MLEGRQPFLIVVMASEVHEAQAPELPRVGDTVGRKYTLVRILGEGAMGVVYEAMHERLQQRLAVKVLRPDFQGYKEVFARFEREARISAQLRSIHTARVIDVDTLESGLPYIVMEHLEGRDLAAEIDTLGPLPVDEAVDVVLQVAAAMQEAHEAGIVHRDLKSANLYVCRSGCRRVMKVLDFGISRLEGQSGAITMRQNCVGTALATPRPESSSRTRRRPTRAAGRLVARDDPLRDAHVGRTPFPGRVRSVIPRVITETPPWVNLLRPELPAALVRLVMMTLERDPRRRFQSMREMAAALAPFGLQQSTTVALTEAQRVRSRLGEILVADGLLQPEQLEGALAEQRRTGALLGKVLLDLGLVSRADLLAALARAARDRRGDRSRRRCASSASRARSRAFDHRAAEDAAAARIVAAAHVVAASASERRTLVAMAASGVALGAVGVAATATAVRSASGPGAPAGMVAAGGMDRPASAQVAADTAILANVPAADARPLAPPTPRAPAMPAPRLSATHAPAHGGRTRFDPTGIWRAGPVGVRGFSEPRHEC